MECGGMTPLWLGVDAAAVNGHGLAESVLSGGRFDAAALNGHERVKFKRPRSQSGSCRRTP